MSQYLKVEGIAYKTNDDRERHYYRITWITITTKHLFSIQGVDHLGMCRCGSKCLCFFRQLFWRTCPDLIVLL